MSAILGTLGCGAWGVQSVQMQNARNGLLLRNLLESILIWIYSNQWFLDKIILFLDYGGLNKIP